MEDTETLPLLIAEVAKISLAETVTPELKLAELGVDSLKFMEVLLSCLRFYPDFSDFEKLSIDHETNLRSLDRQLRGELV
jgi:hypothetical protein